MQIVSISETPNPSTMKINLSEGREGMQSDTYTSVDESQPQFINDILALDGVSSVFHAMDFISVDKTGDADWDTLLPQIQQVFK